MAQTTVIVVTLAVLGTLGALAYVHASRDNSAGREEAKASVAKSTASQSAANRVEAPPVAVPAAEPPSKPEEAPAQQIAADDIARWIAETRSNDASTRAIAIEALANVPKAQAIPALERVLESGEPQVDRQIALRSLHTLALNDGDESGAIRDTIRHAMYHSEDEGVTQSAQAVLEDIEAAFAERAEVQ